MGGAGCSELRKKQAADPYCWDDRVYGSALRAGRREKIEYLVFSPLRRRTWFGKVHATLRVGASMAVRRASVHALHGPLPSFAISRG